MDERIELIQRIMGCSGSLFQNLNHSRDRAWLGVDLTMPQVKTLICVARNNGATSGQIARGLGVGLSTITGIVDRLAEQDLVTRREDPYDRRITRVVATSRGLLLVDELVRYRNEILTRILSRLDAEQLRVVDTAFQYVVAAVDEIAQENQAQEAVA
jgi:DNA-binding MarR family transcriptional regulator